MSVRSEGLDDVPGGVGRRRSDDPPLARPAQIAICLALACIDILNVFARLESGARASAWPRVLFEETSSGVVAVGVVFAIWPVMRRLHLWRPGRARWLAGLATTGLVAGVVHVTTFRSAQLVLGRLIGALGQHSLFGGFGYEIAKDLAFFLLMSVALFGAPPGVRRAIFERRAPAPVPPAAADLLDLFDGRRRFRVRASDVVAVMSAGNYAEFQLADGRRPLVRATLTSLEVELAAHGIVRVHRSCLVNPTHVTLIRTLTSGDRRLTLTGGTAAPVSRRHGAALDALMAIAKPLGCAGRSIAV